MPHPRKYSKLGKLLAIATDKSVKPIQGMGIILGLAMQVIVLRRCQFHIFNFGPLPLCS